MNGPKYTEKGDPDQILSESGDQTPVNVGHGAQIAIDVPAINKEGTKLHPQPTSDALDPLNWSNFQKHVILAIVMFKYVLHFGITLHQSLTMGLLDTSCLPILRQLRFPLSRKSKLNIRSTTPKSTGLWLFPRWACQWDH